MKNVTGEMRKKLGNYRAQLVTRKYLAELFSHLLCSVR